MLVGVAVAEGVAEEVGVEEFEGVGADDVVGALVVNKMRYRDSPSVIPSKSAKTLA